MIRQQVEVCFAALKGAFGMDGTLAKTLVGLVRRIAAKMAAYSSLGGRGSASRSCGPDILATLI